jgi:hypothetical protein
MPEKDPAPTPELPVAGQIQVQIPEPRFEVMYCDQAFVSHTPVGFTLDFAQVTPQLGISRVVARVGMSATHLKLLVGVLSENLKHFEEQYGVVNLTAAMVQEHEQATHHIGFQNEVDRGAKPPK